MTATKWLEFELFNDVLDLFDREFVLIRRLGGVKIVGVRGVLKQLATNALAARLKLILVRLAQQGVRQHRGEGLLAHPGGSGE